MARGDKEMEDSMDAAGGEPTWVLQGQQAGRPDLIMETQRETVM